MLIHLKSVLGEKELLQVQELLVSTKFIDGKLSAGVSAARVKNNKEADKNDPAVEKLNRIIMGNLLQNKMYKNAALPVKIAVPFYVCYEPGMQYGEHIDDPAMGPFGQMYRSDLAITLFLNSPDEYEGGKLQIQTGYGVQSIKYAAGDAVLYPATMRHCVTEVTQGKRWVAVSWVQSMVKDTECRSLLYQLSCARETLLRKQPQEEHTKQVDLVYVNLLRKWSEL